MGIIRMRSATQQRPQSRGPTSRLPLLLLLVSTIGAAVTTPSQAIAAAAARDRWCPAVVLRPPPLPPLAFSSSSSSPSNGPRQPPTAGPPPAPPLIDRVPTFRLYTGGACVGQLRGNGDAQECRQRLHEAITAWLPASPPSPSSPPPLAAPAILELESPAALEALLRAQQRQMQEQEQEQGPSSLSPPPQEPPPPAKPEYQDRAALIQAIMASSAPSPEPPAAAAAAAPSSPPPAADPPAAATAAAHRLLVVEFYGRNCKQCQLVGPMFEALPFAYRGRPGLAFARADVTRFPALVVPPPDPGRFAGLDRSAGIEERLEGCPRCGGGGFVACGACEGKGHVVRSVDGHTVADVCNVCVGHKKVPCPQCGGKCYLC